MSLDSIPVIDKKSSGSVDNEMPSLYFRYLNKRLIFCSRSTRNIFCILKEGVVRIYMLTTTRISYAIKNIFNH